MATQTKIKPKEEPKAKPNQNFRLSNVSMAEWTKDITLENGSVVTVSTFTINKSYKEKDSEEWKYSGNFSETELYKLHRLLTSVLVERDINRIFTKDYPEDD